MSPGDVAVRFLVSLLEGFDPLLIGGAVLEVLIQMVLERSCRVLHLLGGIVACQLDYQ